MLLECNESECAVLEMRDIPINYIDGKTWAAGWAVHLAAAEVYDWWRPGAARGLGCWPVVWSRADDDLSWRISTEQLCTVAADARAGFFKQWVDTWLARAVGMRCYGAADVDECMLRRVHPKEHA